MSSEQQIEGILMEDEAQKMQDETEEVVVNVINEEPGRTPSASTSSTPQGRTFKGTLYRHPSDKLIGGVCGGLADYFGWDAALVRIIWLVATLATGGGGFLAYLALWILLPVGTSQDGQVRPPTIELNERNMGRAAYILISLGGLWLLANLGILPWLWGGFWQLIAVLFWPILLIGAGYLLLRNGSQKEWRVDFSGITRRAKSAVNGKMPSGDEVKSGLKEAKQRFPLKRSSTDRVFMGVCGGIGRRMGIDANLIRLVWAAFSVGSLGMGVLLYVVLGLFLPEETPSDLAQYGQAESDVAVVDSTASNLV